MTYQTFSNKIVLEYFGCFCPPHRGHFEVLENAIRETYPNIVLVITTNKKNPEISRHGIPIDFTIETWNKWGKILRRKYGIEFYVSDDQNLIDFWLKSKPRVHISLENMESYEPNSEIIMGIRDKERIGLSKSYWKHATFLKEFVQKRDMNMGYSATKLVSFLKSGNIESALDFLPKDLEEKEKREYIDDIIMKYSEYLK